MNELANISKPKLEREKLWTYLPKAIERIILAIDSPNEKIAVGAARYIVDQCIGKSMPNESENATAAAATAFAKALQEAHEATAAQEAIQAPAIDGFVRVLGNPIPEEPLSDGILNSESALAEIDEF